MTDESGVAFYRCNLCSGVVSAWDIVDHGACKKCGGVKITPTNLTVWEKIVQIFKHPKVWEWTSV